MSKTSIPLELQVILRDLSIAESETGRALAKVHKRAALQVSDYLHILLIKFEVGEHASGSLETSIAETRRALDCVQHAEESGDEEHEAGVVV
jgi:hypothetical protein